MKQLILATASPRRIELLERLHVVFCAEKSSFAEPAYAAPQLPEQYVMQNAHGKARDVAERYNHALVIGADTVVVQQNSVLGKPASREEAIKFLRSLSGRRHTVYTGVSVIDTETTTTLSECEQTEVIFRDLTDREINAYLGCINPMDKAGAYAIQGAGALIVAGIKGCYYNVVGFPLARLEQMLLKMGASLFAYTDTPDNGAAGV